jgi:hypothetical protein
MGLKNSAFVRIRKSVDRDDKAEIRIWNGAVKVILRVFNHNELQTFSWVTEFKESVVSSIKAKEVLILSIHNTLYSYT